MSFDLSREEALCRGHRMCNDGAEQTESIDPENLKVIFLKISSATEADCEKAVVLLSQKGRRITKDALRESIPSIEAKLQSILTNKRESSGNKSQEMHEKLQPILKKVRPDLCTEQEAREIASLLIASIEPAKLLSDIENNNFAQVTSLLLQALATSSLKEATHIQSLLNKLLPEGKPTPYDLSKLKIFAHVFGDSFIAKSILEGGFTAPFAKVYREFLATKKMTPPLETIDALLEAAIDLKDPELSQKSLTAKILEALALPKCNQRVLLFGGWQMHAVLYEIEKQPDGFYSFTVHNAGAGSESNDGIDSLYKDKTICSLKIRNIKAENLFQSSFLSCLRMLMKFPRSGLAGLTPQEYFVHYLLPMLEGTKEETPFKNLVVATPQRSGTCPYRCLKAFLASCLGTRAHKALKLDFKLYLLEQYESVLQFAAKKKILSLFEYEERVRTKQLFSFAIEKFAASLVKPDTLATKEQVNLTKEKILIYTHLLKEFTQTIELYEKEFNANQKQNVTPLHFTHSLRQMACPQFFSSKVMDVKCSQSYLAAYEAVESLSENTIEEALSKLSANIIDYYTHDSFYLVDQFFKRVGTCANLKKVTFQDPQRAFTLLSQLAGKLVEWGNDYFSPEIHGMFFFSLLGMNQAFWQLAIKDRVLTKSDLKLLPSTLIPFLEGFQTQDPFWKSRFEEFILEAKSKNESLITISKEDDFIFELTQRAVDEICSWFKSEHAKPVREMVEAEIKADREAQEIEIKNRTQELTEGVDKLIKEIENCKNDTTIDDDAKRKKLRELEYSKEQETYKLTHVATNIHESPNYWPWGFETAEAEGGKSDAFRASYLLSKQFPYLLPNAFHTFFNFHQICFELDTNRPKGALHEVSYRFDVKQKEPLKLGTTHLRKGTSHAGKLQGHTQALATQPLLQALFKQLMEKRISDVCIPHEVHQNEIQQLLGAHLELDEAKELFALRSNSELQVDAVLGYFQEHVEKCKDRHWIVLLHALLFESTYLQKELRSKQGQLHLLPKLKSFFSESIRKAMIQEEYTQAANLLWLSQVVQNHLPQECLEQIIEKTLFLELIEECFHARYAHHWPHVFEALFAASHNYLSVSSDKHLMYALFAHIMRNLHPIPVKEQFQARKETVSLAETKVKIMLSLATDNEKLAIAKAANTFLAPALRKIYPNLQLEEFTFQNQTTLQAKDGTLLSLTTGHLVPVDPDALRIFNKPLPQTAIDVLKQHLLLEEAECHSMRCYLENGYVIAYHEQSKTTLILDSSLHWPQIWIKDAQFVQKASRYSLGNDELTNSFHHVILQDELYLLDLKSFQPIYKVLNTTHELCKIDDKSLLRVSHCCPIPQLCNFESTFCIITLLDAAGKTQEIHLPRHQLTFIAEKDRFRLKERNEWYLVNDAYLPGFGFHTGFIILENAKEEQIVLLPVLKARSEEESSLNFPYRYDFEAEQLRSVRHVEYDLVEATLVPRSFEARLFLALIYTEKGSLDKAEELLFSIKAEISYRAHTKEENELFFWYLFKSKSKQECSRSVRLRLRALYLFEKNRAQFPQKEDIGQKMASGEELHKLVTGYLSRLGHIVPLENYEERFLLERLQERSLNEKHKRLYGLRILALDGLTELEEDSVTSQVIPANGINLPVGHPYLNYPNATEGDKKEYTEKRLTNSFPIEPENVTLDEFKAYYRLLDEEVDKVTTWHQAKNSGLLSALYIMALYSQDPTLKHDSGLILRKLLTKVPKFAWSVNRQHYFSPKMPIKGQSLVSRGLLELVPLQGLTSSANLKPFLDYLQKEALTTDQNLVDHVKEIFHPDHPEAHNEATKRFFERNVQEIEQAQHQFPSERYFLAEGKTVENLKSDLIDATSREAQRLYTHEHLIRQSLALLLSTNEQFHQGLVAKRRKIPAISELCMLSAKKEGAQLLKNLFGELSSTSIATLQQALKEYLVQKRHVQLLQDLLRQAELSEIDDIGQLLNQIPAYDLATDEFRNLYLLIEVLLNIRLRKDQVDPISTIVKSLQKKESIAIQLIMGAGKTSVIQPLLAILLLSPGMLSSILVPEALLEPIRQYLAKILPELSQQHLFYMPFNAELAKDLTYLTAYHLQLEEAKKRGSCALFTPRQKHSLITALYKAFHEAIINDDAESKKRVDILCKICGKLQLMEIDQIDEIDFILNSNVVYKCPLGAKKLLDFERASIASEIVIALAQDELLAKKVSIDFVRRFWERKGKEQEALAPELTKELFKSIVQPCLVEHAKKILLTKDALFKRIISSEYLKDLLQGTSPFDDEIQALLLPLEEIEIAKKLPKTAKELEAFIKLPQSTATLLVAKKLLYRHQMFHYFESEIKDEGLLQLLGALAYTTSRILPHSLLRECGTQYGPDPVSGQYVARSYEGALNPRPTIYANPYHQVIFSAQLAVCYGVPRDAVVKMLQNYQLRAKTEIKDTNCQLEKTKSYEKIASLVGEAIKAVQFLQVEGTSPFVDLLKEAIDRDSTMLFEFLKSLVFSQFSLYSESFSSTPQTVVGSSSHSCGYSGTQQEGLFPRGMKAALQPGTDGKTILAIEKKILSGQAEVLRFSSRGQKKLPEQVLDAFLTIKDLYVFIDSCSWLKDETLELYAEKLLIACENSKTRSSIKAINYHDKAGNILMLERNSLKQLVVSPYSEARARDMQYEHLTIIQTRYEIGTNIPQLPKAKALLSLRKNMPLKDALQSSSRMRLILKMQSILFGVSDEVNNHIASGIVNGLLAKKEFRKLIASNDTENAQVVLSGYRLDPKLKSWLLASLDSEMLSGTQENRALQLLTNFCKHFTTDSAQVWRYLSVNQSASNLDRSWLAVPHRMRETLELPIRRVLVQDEIALQLRTKLFSTIRELVTLHHDDQPFSVLKESLTFVDIASAINAEIAFYLSLFDKTQRLDAKIREKLASELQKCYATKDLPLSPRALLESILATCANKKLLPAYVLKNLAGQFFELENEQERERELEPRAHLAKILKKEYLHIAPLTDADSAYDLDQFLEAPFQGLQEFLPPDVLLPDMHQISCSPNLFLENAHLGSCILASYQFPVRYILGVKEDRKPVRYILLSFTDASLLKNSFVNLPHNPQREVVLFALDGTIAATSSEKALPLATNEEAKNVLLQAKLCTSKASFTPSDIELLQTLFSHYDDHKLMLQNLKKFYEDCIRFTPGACKKYSAGPLKKFFHGLTIE